MAYPTLVFNSSTGSNTQASGAGPATAIFGTGASTTASSNSVNLSADSPDLSGVSTDGSAVLWVSSTSGRQASKITAVDNGTKIVTTQDTYANTEGSRTWAIGGKRQTFDATSSRQIIQSDVKPGWTIQSETDQTLTSTTVTTAVAGDTTDGLITLDMGGFTLNHTANVACVTVANTHWYFKNIKFTCSNATRTTAYGLAYSGAIFGFIKNCIFGDPTDKLANAINRVANSPNITLWDCEIQYCTSTAIRLSGGGLRVSCYDCWIHNNTGAGYSYRANSGVILNIIRCIIEDNGADGINLESSTNDSGICIIDCTIDGNAGDGIDSSIGTHGYLTIVGNQITNNGGYGINAWTNQNMININIQGNNIYGNSLGSRNSLTASIFDISVSPEYVNKAGNDFSLKRCSQARTQSFPANNRFIGNNRSNTKSYRDIGVSQSRIFTDSQIGTGGNL